MTGLLRPHISDIIHATVVVLVVVAATAYAALANDSSNIWIVYGSAIAFAAGRAGASGARALKGSDE